MIVLPLTALTDNYTNAIIQECYPSNGGTFTIENASVYMSVQSGQPGKYTWSPDISYGPVVGGILPPGTTGVKFRNQVSGVIASATAWIAGKDDFAPSGGTPQTANIGAMNGSINANGTIASGSGFQCVRNSAGSYNINFNNAQASPPVVMISLILNALGTKSISLAAVPSTLGFSVLIAVGGVATDEPWQFISNPPI